MAGIGFELRKVAALGNARGFFQASISGIMIVAGPWLISILTILMFQQPVMGIPSDFRELFVASTVYIYASSLILSGGFHYIFTRILSDFLYRNEKAEAFYYTLRYMILTTPVLFLLSLGMSELLLQNVHGLHRKGFILLFVFINHIWILMLTASAMKRFNQLLLGFTVGMVSSLVYMKLSVQYFGTDALMMAYALGQVTLFLIILIFLWGDMGCRRIKIKGDFFKYIKKYFLLFLTGFVYYGALWGDKIYYWYTRGSVIGNTAMRLYPEYDIIVYLTNLTMIPGMVLFVIYSETEFYMALRKFLDSLSRKPYHEIRANRRILVKTNRKVIKEQIAIQLVTAIIFLVWSINHPHMNMMLRIVIPTTLSITALGAFVCMMNFLFYVEQYLSVFISCCIFLFANLCIAALGERCSLITPGVSTYLAAALAAVATGVFLYHSLNNLDRIIYTAITKGKIRQIKETHRRILSRKQKNQINS
ncbi:MAG: exopolysaccharide Pel transporter PelG [Spirochaetales bacterium]|nr:exopolysaccharide Pel transporter PelG [Spirochaetales bacterium]